MKHDNDDADLRARSKAMFGSSDRLPVAVAIATSPDGVVNATDLSWQLHIANNRVRAQLIALTELGVLQQMPSEDTKRRWYVRLESPFWDTCLHFHKQWSR